MNSKFRILYEELIDRIETEMPSIKHIDMDFGQLEYEVRPAVKFPALLIDFVNFTFEDLGTDNTQLAVGQINLRLVFAPFSKTSHKINATSRKKGLAYFDLEAELHTFLQGHAITNGDFREMKRVGTTTEQRDDDLRVRNIVYSVSFEDDSTLREYGTHTAKMEVT